MAARLLQARQASLFRRDGSNPTEDKMLKDWNDRRRELARLLLAPPDETSLGQRARKIQQLTEEKERLERQLADSLPGFGRDQGLCNTPTANCSGHSLIGLSLSTWFNTSAVNKTRA